MTTLSERCEVVVEFPLARRPSKVEIVAMVRREAPERCRGLIGPLGKIRGMTSCALAQDKATGQPLLLVKFACDVPEAVQAAARN